VSEGEDRGQSPAGTWHQQQCPPTSKTPFVISLQQKSEATLEPVRCVGERLSWYPGLTCPGP
jgi:hypothetical protein